MTTNHLVMRLILVVFLCAGAEETSPSIREANITIPHFLHTAVTLKVGVVPYSFNIRDKGGSPVFDPRWSVPYDTTPGNTDFGIKDELQPTGALINLDFDPLTIDFILLPAIVEGGPAQDWAQLIVALGVLGDQQRAAAIWDEAQTVFAASPDAIAVLRGAAESAGVAN